MLKVPLKWRRYRIASVVAAVGFSMSPGGAQEPGAHIPEAHGTTLAGSAASLPEAVKGKSGVLVLGFSRGVAAPGNRVGETARRGLPAVCKRGVFSGAHAWRRTKAVTRDDPAPDEWISAGRGALPFLCPWWTMRQHGGRLPVMRKPDDAYVLLVDGEGRRPLADRGRCDRCCL